MAPPLVARALPQLLFMHAWDVLYDWLKMEGRVSIRLSMWV